MKRSHSSMDDEQEFKKRKDGETISNDNYYVIRKGKSTSNISTNISIDRSNDKKDEFYDPFGKKSSSRDRRDRDRKDRYQPFDMKDRFDSFKSKSTASLDKSNTFRYSDSNIKCESRKDDFASNTEPAAGYVIRKSGDSARLTDQSQIELIQLKKQFEDLVKSKNLTCKLEYSIKLSVGNRVFQANGGSIEKTEHNLFASAIGALQTDTMADESMIDITIDESNESDKLIGEIKEVLMKQDNHLLFKDEIPSEYQRKFKRKIDDAWFSRVIDDPSFKLERHGSGNLVSIKLI